MWFKNITILFFVSIYINEFAFAQPPSPAKTDSNHLYRNIESYSRRSKFTKFMYGLFLKPVATSLPQKKVEKKIYKNLIQRSYRDFEGKVIRHVNIKTLDPFGYSITDTIVESQSFLSKAGNKSHIKSKDITIRNLLLIRQNQVFDSLLVKESERLVRSRGYVHDVLFSVVPTSINSDSIDIFIRELDNWSIIPEGEGSTSEININLTDRNFLGLGHESKNGVTWNQTTGNFAYNTNYLIPNIRNTYINATAQYAVDENKYFTKSVAFNRPFFSPLAKWAGGIYFGQQFVMDSTYYHESANVVPNFKFNTQDYWAGKSWQIFKGNTVDKRTTNLIMSERFLKIRYLEKGIGLNDSLHIYSDEDFYLSSIGISKRKYVQDKYIFNFGVTEDVPVGYVYGLTGGYQIKNSIGRLYAGMRMSFGNYNEWGYLSCDFEYGTFLHAAQAEQGIFTAGINYFTGLFEIGKWKLRQFVKPQLTLGMNRFSYEYITLNNDNGIRGFNAPSLTGTKKVVLTLQTQSYSPWNILDFRLGPYFIYSLGMLGDAETGFKKSRIYSQFSIGTIIKNEFLVFDVFQISFAFYPTIPGEGKNIIKTNTNSTTNFGFRDFVIGKPTTILYQ